MSRYNLSDDASGFVLVTDIVPDAILEIRYYSTYNFIGDRIDGYEQPAALLTREAAEALKLVSDDLAGQGYRHEGLRYLCETDREKTIALFSHGGSGACALGHLMQLPFPYVCSVMPYDFTSIIILNFPVRKGKWVFPRLELFNDIAHIQGSAAGPVLQQVSEKPV